MTMPLFSQWRAPEPLWEQALEDEGLERLSEPAILRFTDPTFMAQLIERLAEKAPKLDSMVVRPESRFKEATGWTGLADRRAERKPLKLYQPVHSRYYLVAASLVERRPGFPSLPVEPEGADQFSFVLRRLIPLPGRKGPGELLEYGWHLGRYPGWAPAAPDQALEQEERLPLFPIPYGPETAQRHLFVGIVPAMHRQVYQGAMEPALPVDPAAIADWRLAEFRTQILRPLLQLQAMTEEEASAISPVLCLDLAAFLRRYLPQVWPQIPIEPLWQEQLSLVWEERAAIVQGGADLPCFSLRDAITPADGERLAAGLGSLFARLPSHLPPWARRRRHPAGHLYVIRCLHERSAGEGVAAVLSEPTRPFLLAGYYDLDAPPPAAPGALPAPPGILLKLLKLLERIFQPG